MCPPAPSRTSRRAPAVEAALALAALVAAALLPGTARAAGGAPVPGTPAATPAPSATAAPGAAATSAAAKPPAKKPPSAHPATIRVEYVPPTNPAHEAIYRQLKDAHALEDFARVLRFIKLPRTLTLRLTTCGEANAWYDPDDQSASFCYDMLADFVSKAPLARDRGIAQEEAVRGPFAFFYMHEIGHGLFHLLQIPILGREEDAADQFAAYAILMMGPEVATSILRGTAWTFAHDASSRQADTSDFADAHGLDAQRYYNVLCLAYGSDPAAYAAATERAGLPKERAEGCKDEWLQTRFAVTKLMGQHADRAAFAEVQRDLVARARARRAQQAASPAPAAAPAAPEPVKQVPPAAPAR